MVAGWRRGRLKPWGCFVAAALLLWPFGAQGFRKVRAGEEAPAFSVKTVDGGEVSLGALRGKAVVLAFLRIDQEKSAKAARALADLRKTFGEDRVAVVGIVLNPDAGDPKAWAEGLGVSFPLGLDPQREVYGAYGVLVAPSTGVIDPAGRFVEEVGGYTASYRDDVERLVRRALGEAVEEPGAEAVAPAKTPERKAAERHLQKAKILLKRKMTRKALEAARAAVEADDAFGEAHALLGRLLLEESADNADQAEVHFRKALQANPRSLEAKLGLARVLSLRGDAEGAARILEEAARITPKPERVYYELGRVYEGAERYKEAVEAYRKALERLLR